MRTFFLTVGLMALILLVALNSDQTERQQAASPVVDPGAHTPSTPDSQNPIRINLTIHVDRSASSGTTAAEVVKDEVVQEQTPAPETALANQPKEAAPALPPVSQELPTPVVRAKPPAPVVIQEPPAAQVMTQRQGCGCRYKGECMQVGGVPSTQVVRMDTTRVRRCRLLRR